MQLFFLITALLILAAGIALLRQAADNQPRRYLGYLFTILGTIITIAALSNPQPGLGNGILTLPRVREGGIIVVLLCLYELMVVRPGWLDYKRIALLFAPYLAISVLLIFTAGDGITHLDSLRDLAAHLGRTDVKGRLAAFVLLQVYLVAIILLPLWLCRYKPEQRRWLYGLAAICFTISACYDIFVLTAHPAAIAGNRLFFTVMTAYLTAGALRADNPSRRSPNLSPVATTPEKGCGTGSAQLYSRLCQLMESDRPWLDPDLTLNTLAAQLSTNRTSLSAAIRSQGFSSFNEFVNRYRVDEFKRLTTLPGFDARHADLTGLWTAAGFRSKSTFYRSFLQCENVTPATFLHKEPEEAAFL